VSKDQLCFTSFNKQNKQLHMRRMAEQMSLEAKRNKYMRLSMAFTGTFCSGTHLLEM